MTNPHPTMKKKITINRMVAFVELSDKTIRQVALKEEEMGSLQFFVEQLHGGVVKVLPKVFDTMYIEKPNEN